jgi:hypothetical protein
VTPPATRDANKRWGAAYVCAGVQISLYWKKLKNLILEIILVTCPPQI